MRLRCQGFTLLELSVVVAIIGLLAGGVLSGRSLMQAAELNRVLTDAKSYAIAIQQFKEKYGALPGDISNATEIWGRVYTGAGADPTPDAQCASTITNASVGKTTCNGNGDGVISMNNCEYYRAWQQLAAGGLMGGAFIGVPSPVNTLGCYFGSKGGINVPKGSIDNSIFDLASDGRFNFVTNRTGGGHAMAGAASISDGDYRNALMFSHAVVVQFPRPILTPEQTSNIDQKADDGRPDAGSIRSDYTPPSGIDTNCVVSGQFNTTYTQKACVLIFMSSFQRKQP